MQIQFNVPDEYTKQDIAALLRMARKFIKKNTNPGSASVDARRSHLVRILLEQLGEGGGG